MLYEMSKHIDRISHIRPVFEVTDEHLRMVPDEAANVMDPVIEGRWFLFEWVAARGQPVNPVELKSFQCGVRHV